MTLRGPMKSRHQQLFLGNCCTCNNFGHIARNCKLMAPVEKGIKSQKNNVTSNNLKGELQLFCSSTKL